MYSFMIFSQWRSLASEPTSFDVIFGTVTKTNRVEILEWLAWVRQQETRDISAVFRVGQNCDSSTLLSIRNLSMVNGDNCGRMDSCRYKFASLCSFNDLGIQVPPLVIYSDIFIVLLLPYVSIDASSNWSNSPSPLVVIYRGCLFIVSCYVWI